MIRLSPYQTSRVATSIAALAIILWLALLTWLAVSVPTVHRSHSTGECVRVIPSSAGTCNQLPKKYTTTWIQ